MRDNHLFRWFSILLLISFLFSTCTDGKGFGGGRGGGGFRGGSRGGGSFSGSKGSGTFGGSSSNNRYGSYNTMNRGSGSSFKKNAMSFGAGALGAMTAYSLMRSMSPSYRPGYYAPGYGTGETCINNEDLNGTRFGSFRCPLNDFPYEARYCCGEYGKQYCCIHEENGRFMRGSSNLGWIFLIIIISLLVIFLFAKHRREKQKAVILIPMEPPIDEQPGPASYHPPPPPMGYPPPPMGYPPPGGNPYAVPSQNYEGNFNPYLQQHQMPYPPPPQSYQIKEGGPPTYDDVIRSTQGVPTTRPV